MKLYTKLGDDGSTSLYGGRRVMKDDIRIEVSGEIDELNAHIGLLSTMVEGDAIEMLNEIQARLFIVGASLSSAVVKSSWRVGKEVNGESSLSDIEPGTIGTGDRPFASRRSPTCHICFAWWMHQVSPIARVPNRMSKSGAQVGGIES